MNFKEEMPVSITKHLQNERDGALKRVLDLLDIIPMSPQEKRKLRKVILDEINNLYSVTCRVLTYVQEQDAK